jgi:hypothetical protein
MQLKQQSKKGEVSILRCVPSIAPDFCDVRFEAISSANVGAKAKVFTASDAIKANILSLLVL